MYLSWLATVALLAIETAHCFSPDPIKPRVLTTLDSTPVCPATKSHQLSDPVVSTAASSSIHTRDEDLSAQLRNVTESELRADVDLYEAARADLSAVCSMSHTCVDPMNTAAQSCGSGYTQVGYDYSDCRLGQAKIICCKTSKAPSSCTWRGNVGSLGTDCNARCDEGEVHLYKSSVGGGSAHDTGVEGCLRGKKAFCCKHQDFSALTAGCQWEKQLTCVHSQTCSECKGFVAKKTTGDGGHVCQPATENYCCTRKMLIDCHWIGEGNCADVSCHENEITLATGPWGDSIDSCNWGREKSLCCLSSPYFPPSVCFERIRDEEPYSDPWASDDEEDEEDEEQDEL